MYNSFWTKKEKGNAMIKSLGVLIGGIFIGAVGTEIIYRKYPDALDKLGTKTRKMTSGAREVCRKAKEAFRAGYEGVTRSQRAAATSA